MYTNKNDGKVYIGETIELKHRLKSHMKHDKSSMVFHKALREESYDAFEFSILFEYEGYDKSDVKTKIEEMEEYFIVKEMNIESEKVTVCWELH